MAREGREREQEREDQDGPLGPGDPERVPPSSSEPSVVDDDPQGIRRLAAAAAAVSGAERVYSQKGGSEDGRVRSRRRG
jgi:hypothetical protein